MSQLHVNHGLGFGALVNWSPTSGGRGHNFILNVAKWLTSPTLPPLQSRGEVAQLRRRFAAHIKLCTPTETQGTVRISTGCCCSHSAEVEINHRHAQLLINYAGNVSWYTHSMWKSSCSIDVTNFPFDEQTCQLLFGSWTHTSQELNLDFAIAVSRSTRFFFVFVPGSNASVIRGRVTGLKSTLHFGIKYPKHTTKDF